METEWGNKDSLIYFHEDACTFALICASIRAQHEVGCQLEAWLAPRRMTQGPGGSRRDGGRGMIPLPSQRTHTSHVRRAPAPQDVQSCKTEGRGQSDNRQKGGQGRWPSLSMNVRLSHSILYSSSLPTHKGKEGKPIVQESSACNPIKGAICADSHKTPMHRGEGQHKTHRDHLKTKIVKNLKVMPMLKSHAVLNVP